MSSDVTATLRYLKPTVGKPVYYASRAGVDDSHDIGIEFDERAVRIRNARTLQPSPSLDREAFTLISHDTVVTDFYTLDTQLDYYEAELREQVLAQTGATEALVFDHTLRSDSSDIRGTRATREPAGFVHNDYTDSSARKRLLELLPQQQLPETGLLRYAIINVWRSIRGTVWNSPIACCDAASLATGNLVAAERRAHDRIGELEFATWNPGHRWYYYPEMSEREALLIKTFDSRKDGATRAIHTAFANPLAAVDAAPRESIESRLLVLYT